MKKIDIHTHVLPGVDDGAKDWDTCIAMLAQSARQGVDAVIATPHYLPWKQMLPTEELQKLCREAKERLEKKHGITIDIYLGNEIYYSVDVIQHLKAGKCLAIANTRYVLVEFQTNSTYQTFCRAVKEFGDAGYIPIIAHVERYDCLHNLDKISELKEMGAMVQMNIEAFQGGLFDREGRWAKKCLKQRIIDFLSSDMHSMNRRSPMTEEKLRWIQKKLDSGYQKELLYKNAQKILNDSKG